MNWDCLDIRDLSAADYARYYAMLAPEKRQRVDRFRFADDKKRTVAAELLARRALSARCGVPEEQIVFAAGENGKPRAVGLDAEFSVSHSGDLAVCAVADGPGGADVEQLRPLDLRVARRVCMAEELRFLFGREPVPADFVRTEDPALLERFYTLWTQKEAYGKYTGDGIFRAGFPRPETGFQTFRRGDYIISIYPG